MSQSECPTKTSEIQLSPRTGQTQNWAKFCPHNYIMQNRKTISKHAVTWAQWPVPGMFHNLMVYTICANRHVDFGFRKSHCKISTDKRSVIFPLLPNHTSVPYTLNAFWCSLVRWCNLIPKLNSFTQVNSLNCGFLDQALNHMDPLSNPWFMDFCTSIHSYGSSSLRSFNYGFLDGAFISYGSSSLKPLNYWFLEHIHSYRSSGSFKSLNCGFSDQIHPYASSSFKFLSCGFFGSCIRSYGPSSLKYLNCGFSGSSIHLIWIPFSQILELWVSGSCIHSYGSSSLKSLNCGFLGSSIHFIWILFSQILELWIFWVQAFISYGFSALKSLNCFACRCVAQLL